MQDNISNNQRIAKNTMFLYIRSLMTMVISLYTSRVILQVLGVEDYGIYNVVGSFVSLMGFLCGAMSISTSRYITYALGKGDEKYLRDVFSTALLAHLLIAALIVVVGETVGLWFLYNKLVIPVDRLLAAMIVYQVSLVSIVVSMWSIPYNACIIAHEKMDAFAYISIFDAISKLLIVFFLMIISYDKLIVYSILLFSIQLLLRFIYSWYCNKHFIESKYNFIWDKCLFKEILSFAGWNLWGSGSYALFTQGLNILLNMFYGPIVNSARGLAIQVQSAVSIFSANFQTATNPQITKSYAVNDFCTMHALICRSSKFSFFLLFCLSLPIIMETDFILVFWLGDVPNYTLSFLRLMLCICIIDAMSCPLMTAAAATGKVKKYQSVIGTILLMIVPVSYVALKMGGIPEVVFYVQIVIFIFAAIVRLFIIRPMIHLPIIVFLNKAVFPCFIVTIISLIIMFLFGILIPLCHIKPILMMSFSVITVTITFYIFGMTQGERAFMFSKIITIIKKNDNNYR